MSQYMWICLNNAQNDWICRHIHEKQSAEYARILNVADAVHGMVKVIGHSIVQGHCTNCRAVIKTDIFRTLWNI